MSNLPVNDMTARALSPRDTYDFMQWTMIHAHEAIKCGFDNVVYYLDSEHLPRDDLYNFLGYCLAWAQLLKDHHDCEEAVVFPFLNQKLDFHPEMDQHKGIATALGEIIPTIQQAQADPSQFNPDQLKSLMVPLRDPLFQHLDDEVVDLAAEKLKVFTEDELKKMHHDYIQWSKRNGSAFLALPFMRCHTPPEYKDHWPGMPWFLRNLLIPYVFAWPHSGYWKFAPYSV